jgi:hypothetical protein
LNDNAGANSAGVFHFSTLFHFRFMVDSARTARTEDLMPKKPGTNPKSEFVFFDVVYEDGSQRSNRRVPAELLGGLAKDEPARGFIIEQDREIAEKSGRAPLAIKSIARVGAKPDKMMNMKERAS